MKKKAGLKGPSRLRPQGIALDTPSKAEDDLSEGCILLMTVALKTPAEVMTKCSAESGSGPALKPGLHNGSAFAAKCLHAP